MSNLPCIKDKCMLLPVCKTKIVITCDKLYDKINNSRKNKPIYYDKAGEIFPNAEYVSRENNPCEIMPLQRYIFTNY